MVNESSPVMSEGMRRRRRRTSRFRRRLREQFPAYRVRRIVFLSLLALTAVGAGFMLGRYQPSDSSAAAE